MAKQVLKLKKGGRVAKEVTELVNQARILINRIEHLKGCYSRLDEVTLALMGEDLTGTGLELVDNFAQKNVAWKAAGIRRFELKLVEA